MNQRYLTMLTSMFNSFGINISSLTEQWISIFQKEKKYRGRKTAVLHMKELNTIGERFALHKEITALPFRKSNTNGFPKELSAFKRYLRGTILQRIAALSVLRACETLRVDISKDISTVTDPSYANTETVESICDYAKDWVSKLNLKLDLKALKYHYTTKNGPNGPAMSSSDFDIGAVYEDPDLLGAILTIQTKLGNKYPITNSFKRKPGGIHSKLTQFPEKSGKTRTIAIIDYYSQLALKPLHKGLMKILRSLKSDGTFSHRNVGVYAKQATEDSSFIACYDLSAFTDRFPWEIQYALLHALIPEDPDLANALWTLLAKRTFTVAWSGDKVAYECGQPMGAYASWPLCSLAHHLAVEYASRNQSFGIKDKYRLIGDDIIITDELIASKYENIIKHLGVELNLSKSVLSEENSRNSAAEVAKQLFYKGKSISPVTPGLLKSLSNPLLINQAMEELIFKLNIKPSQILPKLLKRLLPKEESLEKGLVLVTNPISGSLRHINEDTGSLDDQINLLQDYHRRWAVFELEEVKQQFYEIRFESLLQQAATDPLGIILVPSEHGLELWADRLPDTDIKESQAFASLQISNELGQAQETLMELMYDDFEEDGADMFNTLLEVEFLDNPFKPFQAKKDNREIRKSSILLEVAKQLEV